MPAPTHLAAVLDNARTLRERGDLAGARALLGRALDLAGATYGADHPEVLDAARLLASLHQEAGDLPAARRTLEAALAAGQLSVPAEDPLMVLLAYDLGGVADELGNRHEARRNYGTVVRLGPDALGQDHPAVRTAKRYLDDQEIDAEALPMPPAPAPTPFATTEQAPQRRARVRPRRRRTPVPLLVVATLAVATALTTVVLALRPRAATPPASPATTQPSTASPTPPARAAPAAVRLRDDGDSITVSWQDPSGGTVPFIVTGARAGEQSRPFANLPPGRTTYTVNGLNPRLQYCFAVVAVYATDSVAVSELVCTRRASNPQPTRSR